jgi:peptidoglycan hydrolase-like protein with peptidoglycan-binding domain
VRALRCLWLAAALTIVATACDQPVFQETAPDPGSTPTAPPAPAPPVAVPESGLGVGDKGEPVRALEQRLDSLHFYVGQVDDVFDDDTHRAVTAFQKITGLPLTGRATPDLAQHLATAKAPAPIVPAGGATRVEVDLPHQVLFLYTGGALDEILSISTGSGEDYCTDEGGCQTAVTPPGSYKVDYHFDGWDESPLGRLYNPVYFDPKNGLAIHGFEDVPADPASHGCVRISMSAAEWFPDKAPKATPVYVSDGMTGLQPV